MRLWRPIYSADMDGDPSALIEIKHNGRTFTQLADWKNGETGWVDFGILYFNGSGDEYIKVVKNKQFY